MYLNVYHIVAILNHLLRFEKQQQQEWVVVDYIQKPYYDDHFDIERESLKLGKSLKMVGWMKWLVD